MYSKKVSLIIIGLMMNVFFIPSAKSSVSEEVQVIMSCGKGWESSIQSRTVVSHPFSVWIDGRILYIENSAPFCDLTIVIVNLSTGEEEYRNVIPEACSSYIVIPVTHLNSGEYRLEISNIDAGEVEGEFSL